MTNKIWVGSPRTSVRGLKRNAGCPILSAFLARRVGWLVLVLILLLALSTIAATQSRFDQVGHTLMCTCGCNEILLECNHVGCPNSDGMRLRLASMVKGGDSDDAIYKDFIAEYGNIVVASPIGGGFNRIAWIMPFAVLFAGLIGVGVVAKRWHQPATAETNPLPIEHDMKLEPFRQQARKETEE